MGEPRLHVEREGSGPVVVLTHGLGDSTETWGPVVPALAERFTVVRWDLRGHGRSEEAERYSRDEGVADLERVVADDAPVHLVGHSLGGQLSLVLALRRPAAVRTLTLIASGPGFRDPAARARWNEGAARVARRFPIPPAAAGLVTQPDSWVIDNLPALAVPLLQIVGGDDTRYHAGVEHIARKVPGSAVVTIDGAAHHPQRSHPARVVEALTTSLR
jgi:pimeloyl-ACP methyl ester carboxylesterase